MLNRERRPAPSKRLHPCPRQVHAMRISNLVLPGLSSPSAGSAHEVSRTSMGTVIDASRAAISGARAKVTDTDKILVVRRGEVGQRWRRRGGTATGRTASHGRRA